MLRTASPDTPLAKTPWRILLKQGEQYMQVGQRHCFDFRLVQNAGGTWAPCAGSCRVARMGLVSFT